MKNERPMPKSPRALRSVIKAQREQLERAETSLAARVALVDKQVCEVHDLQKQVRNLKGNEIHRVEVVSVVLVRFSRGSGTKDDPIREVRQYWDENEGELIVEKDPRGAKSEDGLTFNCAVSLPALPDPGKIAKLVSEEIAKAHQDR